MPHFSSACAKIEELQDMAKRIDAFLEAYGKSIVK